MILEIVRNTRVKSISHRLIWQLVLTFSSSRYASHFLILLSSSRNTFPFLFLLIDIIWQGELWYQHKSKKEIWRRNSFSVSSVIGDQWDCRQWHSSNPHSAPNAQRWSRFTLAAFLDMCFNIICLLVEKHLYWFFMLLSFPFWFSFTSKIDFQAHYGGWSTRWACAGGRSHRGWGSFIKLETKRCCVKCSLHRQWRRRCFHLRAWISPDSP